MIKVLFAYGQPGKGEHNWNWCNSSELVGIFGTTCSETEHRCICGCGISFTGTETGKATSQGVVQEIEEEDFSKRLDKFSSAITKRWPGKFYVEYRAWCVESMKVLSEELGRYELEQVLGIEKKPSLRLIPQTQKRDENGR